MPLSNSTKNWMKAPYQMDMAGLKDVAKKEASAVIDGLRNDAEIRHFLSMISITERDVIRDRKARKVLAANLVPEGAAK